MELRAARSQRFAFALMLGWGTPAGVVALVQHQPYGVWYGLLFPGALGLGVLGSLRPLIQARYREV